jgi:secreted Zn-dependent insulinase-like peptidase
MILILTIKVICLRVKITPTSLLKQGFRRFAVPPVAHWHQAKELDMRKSKEIPNLKFQINFKNQITNLKQDPKTKYLKRTLFGALSNGSLGFVCYLCIGVWDLPSKISGGCLC